MITFYLIVAAFVLAALLSGAETRRQVVLSFVLAAIWPITILAAVWVAIQMGEFFHD